MDKTWKTEAELLEAAHRKVNRNKRLADYEHILFYDWPNWSEHLQWIIDTPVDAIVDWCLETMQAELDSDNDDR